MGLCSSCDQNELLTNKGFSLYYTMYLFWICHFVVYRTAMWLTYACGFDRNRNDLDSQNQENHLDSRWILLNLIHSDGVIHSLSNEICGDSWGLSIDSHWISQLCTWHAKINKLLLHYNFDILSKMLLVIMSHTCIYRDIWLQTALFYE